MNKIDLIIDALEKAKDGWQSFDEYEKALAAARELKALQPVLWKHSGDGWSYEQPLFEATPLYALYALDEVKHD